ncbi:MAG: hypothetical protein BWY31_01547 [Lentisphaerae bacterium ADurb.Bin242]|nr:MAG: hypothetical protein BWY31_01547 [Lentisphaerae bacterium ADurb.Bin242]
MKSFIRIFHTSLLLGFLFQAEANPVNIFSGRPDESASLKRIASRLNYEVLIPDGVGEVVQAAAAELKSYLEKLYDAEISLNGKIPEKIQFIVTAVPEKTVPLKGEFAILNDSCRIVICGYDDADALPWQMRGRTGTLLGVYYFLQKYAGAEFFAPGPKGEKLGKNNLLRLEKYDSPVPSYRVRYLSPSSRSFHESEMIRFYKKMLCSVPCWAWPDFYYTVRNSWNKRFKDREKEMFAIYDGRYYNADYPFHMPCLSKPEVFNTMLHDILGMIAARKNCKTIRFFSDTPVRLCECPECRKSGSVDNWYYGYMNRLAHAVHEKYPEMNFMTQEKYGFYMHVPEGMKPMEKNLAIEIKTGFPAARAYEHFYPLFEEWKAAGVKTLIRYYARIPLWKDYPCVYPRETARHFKQMQGRAEGTRWCDGSRVVYAQCALLNYMQARVMFNADMDAEAGIRRFCSLAYPGAEAEMTEYYRVMENLYYGYEHWMNPLEGALQYENLLHPRKLLEAASKKVSDDSWLAPLKKDFERVFAEAEKIRDVMAEHNRIMKGFDPELGRSKIIRPTRIHEKIEMDGLDREVCWKDAYTLKLFPNTTAYSKFQNSSVKLTFDKDFMYFFVTAEEDEPQYIQCGSKKKDGSPNIWADDHFEVMIASRDPAKSEEYIHFAFNPAGDSFHIRHYPGRKIQYIDSRISAKGRIDTKRKCWTLEFAVPRSAIREICPGEEAKLGLFRTRILTPEGAEKYRLQRSGLDSGGYNNSLKYKNFEFSEADISNGPGRPPQNNLND